MGWRPNAGSGRGRSPRERDRSAGAGGAVGAAPAGAVQGGRVMRRGKECRSLWERPHGGCRCDSVSSGFGPGGCAPGRRTTRGLRRLVSLWRGACRKVAGRRGQPRRGHAGGRGSWGEVVLLTAPKSVGRGAGAATGFCAALTEARAATRAVAAREWRVTEVGDWGLWRVANDGSGEAGSPEAKYSVCPLLLPLRPCRKFSRSRD